VHRANEDPLRSYLIRDLHDASRFASAKLMARVGEEFPLECPWVRRRRGLPWHMAANWGGSRGSCAAATPFVIGPIGTRRGAAIGGPARLMDGGGADFRGRRCRAA